LQAWYLIKAELFNEAHDVTIKWIAPDAIINDDYSFFAGLLDDLVINSDFFSKLGSSRDRYSTDYETPLSDYWYKIYPSYLIISTDNEALPGSLLFTDKEA